MHPGRVGCLAEDHRGALAVGARCQVLRSSVQEQLARVVERVVCTRQTRDCHVKCCMIRISAL
jgi:hypothetical protein